jgi:hypothetical protein
MCCRLSFWVNWRIEKCLLTFYLFHRRRVGVDSTVLALHCCGKQRSPDVAASKVATLEQDYVRGEHDQQCHQGLAEEFEASQVDILDRFQGWTATALHAVLTACPLKVEWPAFHLQADPGAEQVRPSSLTDTGA